MIANMLMDTSGWAVYGYKPDHSDSYTDYYSPEDWSGIAEKNGYILCVNVKDGAPARQLNYGYPGWTIPAHMANPPRCNWHVEKDGEIVAKGKGILKFAQISQYHFYKDCLKRMEEYREDTQNWFDNQIRKIMSRSPRCTSEEARDVAEYRESELKNEFKLCEDFKKFIQRIDRICEGQAKNETPPVDVRTIKFHVSERLDTQNNSTIYIVKMPEWLSKSDFIKVCNYMESLGGQYSSFTHAFLFYDDPTYVLNRQAEE